MIKAFSFWKNVLCAIKARICFKILFVTGAEEKSLCPVEKEIYNKSFLKSYLCGEST